MSDKAKYGYLAGIIDGEGCITIGAGRRTTTSAVNFNSIILVQNTSYELIQWLNKNFGGHVYLSKRKTEKTKAAWMWRITKQKEVELLLLAILPYLVIKREQAKTLLEFVRLSSDNNPEVRSKLYMRLRLLNSRGISVTTNTQEVDNSTKIESELIGDNKSAPVEMQGEETFSLA